MLIKLCQVARLARHAIGWFFGVDVDIDIDVDVDVDIDIDMLILIC